MILKSNNKTKSLCHLSTFGEREGKAKPDNHCSGLKLNVQQIIVVKPALKLLILFSLFIFSFNQTYSQSWHTYFGDTLQFSAGAEACPNHCPHVWHIYVEEDSLFMGGGFTFAGDLELRHIGKWHNYQWYNLGITYTWNDTHCMIKYDDKLFVGGHSGWEVNIPPASPPTNFRYLSYWDGEAWHPAAENGTGGAIQNFKIHNDTLFVCGAFTTINGIPARQIMAYYNEQWIHIGNLGVNTGMVIEVFNDELLVGSRYSGIKKRTGPTSWSSFPGMSSGIVEAMTVDTINNFLYIGGSFNYVGNSIFSKNIAMWDGFHWHSLDNGVEGSVLKDAMAIYHGDLYIGGVPSHTINGLQLNRIGRWDGEQWHDLDGGCNNSVLSLVVFKDTLIVGGAFHRVGLTGDSLRALGIAKWHMPPPEDCRYLKPLLYAYEEFGTSKDTFYLSNGQAVVYFYNNNAYVDTWEWDFGDGGTADVKDPVHIYTESGEYNVQVTVTDGECVKTANKTIWVELGTNVPEYKNIAMEIFPNPSNSNFTVKTDLPAGVKAELRIAGINSHLRASIPINSKLTEINTFGWQRGVYVCNLFVEGKLIRVEKLVLE